jgi:hypothetical protein
MLKMLIVLWPWAATLYMVALSWAPATDSISIIIGSGTNMAPQVGLWAMCRLLYNLGLLVANVAASYAVWQIGRQIFNTIWRQKYGLNLGQTDV